MQFTGNNLKMVYAGLDLVVAELHNRIVTCPDPDDDEFKEALDLLEQEKAIYERLLKRVRVALEKENP